MPSHSTQFEATAGGLALTNAILLYRSEPTHGRKMLGAPAFASIHAVELEDERPTIAAGIPLTRAHLRQWAEALDQTVVPEILPENVLVSHAEVLAWWVPEQVRPAFFALTNPPKGVNVLSTRTIVPIPYPAHLFVATRSGLGVYALPASQRPTADTELLHSPILNVFITGKLCWGNVARPKALTIASIPEFERAVFDSWSTHPNPGQELTVTGKGGLVRLWEDLAARQAQRFPVKRLKAFDPREQRRGAIEPITLGKLIAGSVQR
jgi:PRTRC genetic system protein B